MSGFTKLDSSLTASSIWNEADTTRIVWVTMLSLADKDGDVKGSVVGLAHLSRKTLPETQAALDVLLAPDPHSGRKEMEGRRLVPVAGGWHLVTHCFYRESGMSEDTKRYWRDKKQAQRSRQRVSRTVKDKPQMSRSLGYGSGNGNGYGSVSEKKPKSASACTQQEVEEFCESLCLPRSDGEAMFLHWQEKGPAKVKDWKATIRKWKSFGYLPSQKTKATTKPFGAKAPTEQQSKLDREFEEARRTYGSKRTD